MSEFMTFTSLLNFSRWCVLQGYRLPESQPELDLRWEEYSQTRKVHPEHNRRRMGVDMERRTPSYQGGPLDVDQQVLRICEEFEAVAHLGTRADIESAMLNVEPLRQEILRLKETLRGHLPPGVEP